MVLATYSSGLYGDMPPAITHLPASGTMYQDRRRVRGRAEAHGILKVNRPAPRRTLA